MTDQESRGEKLLEILRFGMIHNKTGTEIAAQIEVLYSEVHNEAPEEKSIRQLQPLSGGVTGQAIDLLGVHSI